MYSCLKNYIDFLKIAFYWKNSIKNHLYLFSLKHITICCGWWCFIWKMVRKRKSSKKILRMFLFPVRLPRSSCLNNRTFSTFLANLSWKLKWAFLIAFRLSVCPSVCPSVNFSYFRLLLKNHWTNFNQTWHKASLGEGDSSLFKWRPPFSKGR